MDEVEPILGSVPVPETLLDPELPDCLPKQSYYLQTLALIPVQTEPLQTVPVVPQNLYCMPLLPILTLPDVVVAVPVAITLILVTEPDTLIASSDALVSKIMVAEPFAITLITPT